MATRATQLILSETDYETLIALTEASNTESAMSLADEVANAQIVSVEALPKDVVRLGSKVTVRDEDSGTEQELTLVTPRDANVAESKISVLAPMGTAIIGLQKGSYYEWPLPDGRVKRFTVVDVA